jgi:hypothetical protein
MGQEAELRNTIIKIGSKILYKENDGIIYDGIVSKIDRMSMEDETIFVLENGIRVSLLDLV